MLLFSPWLLQFYRCFNSYSLRKSEFTMLLCSLSKTCVSCRRELNSAPRCAALNHPKLPWALEKSLWRLPSDLEEAQNCKKLTFYSNHEKTRKLSSRLDESSISASCGSPCGAPEGLVRSPWRAPRFQSGFSPAPEAHFQ